MGILIRLDLVQNNRELNVKVLNDEGLADSVGSKSDILANFNVKINKKDSEEESAIIVESVKNRSAKSTNVETEKESDITVIENDGYGIQLKSVSGAATEQNVEEESDTLEEYFVVEKIIGNRFNPSTKQHEFLLKLKDCQPVGNRWKPVFNAKTNSLPEEEGLLFVQKSKSLIPLKQNIRSRCPAPRYQDNRSADWRAERNCQAESSIGTQSEGNIQRTEPRELRPNVRNNTDEILQEHFLNSNIPPTNDLCTESDSIQNVNDISIKCEPIIEDEGDNDFTYEQMDSVPFGNHSENIGSSMRDDVKPCVTYLQSNISNSFSCNLCGRSFSGIQYLRKHEKIHSKATVFTCSVCSFAFSNLYFLTAHEREAHGIHHAPKRRGCPPGTRKRIPGGEMELPSRMSSFGNPIQSQIQVSSFAKSFEPVDKPFKCQLCVRSFRNEQALALHEGVHNDGRLFTCNVCDRVFTYLHALKNHERIHSNVKPVPCSYCGKLFTMESRRKLHERKHRIDMKGQKAISVIPIVRSQDEVEKPHVCRYCTKAFRLKHTLVVHTRIHTGEKPFACPVCDYRSSQKISLDCHMRKHEKSWMQNITY